MSYSTKKPDDNDNSKIFKKDVKVISILYVHRITEKRLTTKPPISAFKRLCGDDFAKRGADSAKRRAVSAKRGDDSAEHGDDSAKRGGDSAKREGDSANQGDVIFVTTHWDCVPIQYGQVQEQNLQHYLQSVLGFPVRMERFDKTTQAARDIIGQII